MPDAAAPSPRHDGRVERRSPTIVVDSSAVIEEIASDRREGQRQSGSRRLDPIRNGESGPFGYDFEDRLTIAVVGVASRDNDLVRQIADWAVGAPGFIFTGGVLRVSRYIRQRIDFLVHGKSFDHYGYGSDVGETLLMGAPGLEDWSAVSAHIARAWASAERQ
ncbi:hypothetical protein [Microbacterium kunmingense]|uniref:hypothetical protein n=1 Tax=Microbacterium kunmingense TaxID=2915939 RepID=UPI003D71CBC5